jgi:hypothetical protein
MTRHLPHVGLNIPQAGQSLYGDESTIGARGQAERDATLDWFASALGLRGRLESDASGLEPYRTVATVGEPIREIEDAQVVDE